ncbi:MAG: hypothetical protein WCH85_03605 [Methanomicrobiales archaeon]
MLSDHRAFLFNKAKNQLVIPARVVKQDAVQDKKLGGDQPQIWYGAYVFGVNPQVSFTSAQIHMGRFKDAITNRRQNPERQSLLAGRCSGTVIPAIYAGPVRIW